jgi:hypothetical protein
MNTHRKRSSYLVKDCFEKSQNYCSTGELQQNWIFILKTLFPLKVSEVSLTNPTAGLQLLNLWLLKVMLRCINDGVTTIKRGHQTTGNAHVIWSDEFSFTLFPTSGRVYVWRTPKQAYNPECLVPTVRHRVGSVMVWAAILWYSILLAHITTLHVRITAREHVDRLGKQVHPNGLESNFRHLRTNMKFSKTTMSPFTQLKLFSHCLQSIKVNLNIFPGQHSHQIWTSINHSGHFSGPVWGTGSNLQLL